MAFGRLSAPVARRRQHSRHPVRALRRVPIIRPPPRPMRLRRRLSDTFRPPLPQREKRQDLVRRRGCSGRIPGVLRPVVEPLFPARQGTGTGSVGTWCETPAFGLSRPGVQGGNVHGLETRAALPRWSAAAPNHGKIVSQHIQPFSAPGTNPPKCPASAHGRQQSGGAGSESRRPPAMGPPATGLSGDGAGGRTRTDTLSPETDFESVASTSSATPARHRSQLLDALMLHLGSRRTIKNLSVDQL